MRSSACSLFVLAAIGCGGAQPVEPAELACTDSYPTSVVRDVLGPALRRTAARPECESPDVWMDRRLRVGADGYVDRASLGTGCAQELAVASACLNDVVASVRFPPLASGRCAWVSLRDATP